MILFADKDTGKIIGTIEGRQHGQDHAKMWIGDKNKTIRIVIQYKKGQNIEKEIEVKTEVGQKKDKNGFFKPIFKIKKQKINVTDMEPDIDGEEQKQFVKEIENGAKRENYKIDIKTKKILKVQ